MKNLKSEIKLVATNIEVVRNFIFLVEKYFNELPQELKKSILEIEKADGLSNFTNKDIELYLNKNNLDYSDIEIFIDGIKTSEEIVWANVILKRYMVSNGSIKSSNSFKIIVKNIVLLEWKKEIK